MAYHIQSSFTAGELDPALHERTTFDKYKTGVATGRNVIIGKTGRIISRFGSEFVIAPKYSDKKHVLYAPPYSNLILEWGHLYWRLHNLDSPGTYVEGTHLYTEDHLKTHIHFTSSKFGIYIFLKKASVADPFSQNSYEKYLFLVTVPGSEILIQTGTVAETNNPLALSGGITSNMSGYGVDYMFTVVVNGVETTSVAFLNSTYSGLKSLKIVGEFTTFPFTIDKASFPQWQNISELRAYRRPKDGGAYGYIGSTGDFNTSGSTAVTVSFTDIGQGADYTMSPPNYYSEFANNQGPLYSLGTFPQWSFSGFQARTGIMFQQRLCVVDDFQNAIAASRVGVPKSFTRDYPLNSACSLLFKVASEGSAKILRLLDAGALAAFTTDGVYANNPGPLTPENLALSKKGEWVIDEKLPPLIVPGAVLFFDILSNSIVAMDYSFEGARFNGEEVSIFSNHLIAKNRIVSWAFLDGQLPVVLAVRDDGKLLCFSYQREHQLKAWTWFDTDGLYENIVVRKKTDGTSVCYASVLRGTTRSIEKFTPRFVNDIKDFIGMDNSKTFKTAISGTASITVAPVTPGIWGGELTLTASSAIFANSAGNGAVGSVFRYFDIDGSAVDLTVTAFTSTTVIKAKPSCDYPSTETPMVGPLYKTFTTLTGLDHLNGKAVSVMLDGYVIASPNNDIENYATLTVTGGSLTLPRAGAIIHVGLPFTSDGETLDVDTVEQKPTLLESDLVNKLYLKIYNTRGTYVGSKFPKNNKVNGMTDPEVMTEDLDFGNLGNAAQVPQTKRYYLVMTNDWNSRGRVCIRQVDPLPFEILSVIPDLTILYP
ncbi:MAG: hypothetical protein ACKOX6_16895 [Bdellovibrio sp.]